MLEVMNIWNALAEGKVVSHDALIKLYEAVPAGDNAVVKRGSIKSLSALDPEVYTAMIYLLKIMDL